MTTHDHIDEGARVAERIERRWATLSVAIIVVLAGMAAFAGIHQATMPQARVETIQPQTIHLTGEFIESNLGSAVEPDGSVTVRAVGQQYSFTPQCMVVPNDTPVVFRATSPDVVHGFLIQKTNVNTMLVPGYVSEIPAKFTRPGEYLMPCQEYCGVGHEGMWAKVKVVEKPEFLSMIAANRRVTCVE
ncbi:MULTISPECIES: cytochrome C oxidase subunit II [Methylobacterium]|jgi:cytochrome c oxidase subunit II|uniref:Cytochrome C oxidase subunit II n=1 Tax=Methylobacterium aquaticum TaxID=270351 RepID=A0A0C6FUL0_9HYPH|nr:MULTISPECIES: cytochrome C oxidase subunit II [Methylobacterium]NGM39023.1 cytochrome C oxidase subunit II [Methylobacterium sp. DB0501]BAQ49234.1 cytochrome C oxidase subunit II [Methylobacterium aquaticum]